MTIKRGRGGPTPNGKTIWNFHLDFWIISLSTYKLIKGMARWHQNTLLITNPAIDYLFDTFRKGLQNETTPYVVDQSVVLYRAGRKNGEDRVPPYQYQLSGLEAGMKQIILSFTHWLLLSLSKRPIEAVTFNFAMARVIEFDSVCLMSHTQLLPSLIIALRKTKTTWTLFVFYNLNRHLK